MGDALHKIPVADNTINKMVDNVMTGPIKTSSQVAFGKRHADAIGKSLSQRAGGGLHARCETLFGMAGGFTAPLAKTLKLFQG